MSIDSAKITFTKTDEAPALATYSLLPIIAAFTEAADVVVEARDISLAGRIIALFPDYLTVEQQQPDELAYLGELAKTPGANIIKLPNISASMPQLQAAIKELQHQDFAVPDYPYEPVSDAERDVKVRYDGVKGSAVNPVLRDGNSDRRAPASVKAFARNHPHRMGAWSADSKTHVAHMDDGDFYGSEQSTTFSAQDNLRAVLKADGQQTILIDSVSVLQDEIVDVAVMSKRKLRSFFEKETAAAKAEGVLLSLHLKATMMKVSDPIIFGNAVAVYFADVFAKHAKTFRKLGISPNNGVGDLLAKLAELSPEERDSIEADLKATYASQPELAMVNSDKGIANFHVPSDFIVDASMPAMIRDSGRMWAPDGSQKDTKAMIPDRCYAGVYQSAIDFCREHGAFDPATMGTVPNVGLMAQKAEEYGSHDKTFEIPADGTVQVLNQADEVVFEHRVEAGDIWRMCQVKDAPIRDWVGLAVSRARLSNMPAVFWLDSERAHDREVIDKVSTYLKEHDTSGLDIQIMQPVEATHYTLTRAKAGQDTISVTGNVLRDYLTDLFPILELGTSAKMLSIVPLINGGGMFETGAGGSAPKHVQQLIEENHLRWDSLGEFLALSASLEHLARVNNNPGAQVLADALDQAISQFLENNRSPSRKVGELDIRGSHFYLAMYWARNLATQEKDRGIQNQFGRLADQLVTHEEAIIGELNAVQGHPVDIGGYYRPQAESVSKIMRPSETLNQILASL